MMKKVDEKMKKMRSQRASYLESAKLGPISDDYKFSNAGLYLLIGPIGSGKSHFISKHILYTDQLKNASGEPGYYRSIIFITGVHRIDETTETFLKGIKNTYIMTVHQSQAINFLNELFALKNKYYGIYRAIMSELKDLNDETEALLKKHNLLTDPKEVKKLKHDHPKHPANFLINQLHELGAYHYPVRTLIVIDDAAGNELIQKRNSDLIKIIKISRHLHATVILSAQSISDSMKDLKRIATDMVLFKRISISDLEKVLEDIPLPDPDTDEKSKSPYEKILSLYQQMKGKHSKLILNIVNDHVEISE